MIIPYLKRAIVFFLLLQCTIAHSQTDSVQQLNKWEIEAEEAYEFAKANLYANTDSVIVRFVEIEPQTEEIQNYNTKFNVYNILGICFQIKSDYENSNTYFKNALSIANANIDSTLRVKATHNIAINYRYQANYEKALEVFLQNLEVANKTNDLRMIGFSLSEIANVYVATENWPKAIDYQQKALQFHIENNNARLIGTSYNSLAYIYSDNKYEKQNVEKARILLDSAMIYHKKANNLVGLANAQRQKCNTYGADDDFNKSTDCYKYLLELDVKIGNPEGELIDYINIGKNLTNQLKHKEATNYLKNGLQLAKKLNKQRFILAAYKALAINSYNINQYKIAYLYSDSAAVLNDSLQGLTVQENIAELETKYQLSEKERLILEEKNKSIQLEQEKTLANIEVQKRNYWILFLVLFLIIAGTSVYLFIQNGKKKQQLKEAELLRVEKQKALKAVIDAEEEERKRIAKDLHDGIGQKLSGLKMGWKRVSNEIDNPAFTKQISDLTETLENSAEEIRAISHKMMPIALREVGISAALKSMLENTFRFSEIKYTYDQSNAEGRFKESAEVTIYRIAQELVNNAIKHSKAKELNVQLIYSNNFLVLIVQDDGTGVDLDSFKKGHGFMNIDSRLSVNEGEINLESKKNQGLFAQVRIKTN